MRKAEDLDEITVILVLYCSESKIVDRSKEESTLIFPSSFSLRAEEKHEPIISSKNPLIIQ